MIINVAAYSVDNQSDPPGDGADFAEETNFFYLEAVCIPEIIPDDESIWLGDFWIQENNHTYNLDPSGQDCSVPGSGVPMRFTLYGQTDAQYSVWATEQNEVQAGPDGKMYLTCHWEVIDANPSNQEYFACGNGMSLSEVELIEGDAPCDAYAEIYCYANYLEIEPGAAPAEYSFVMKVTFSLDSY